MDYYPVDFSMQLLCNIFCEFRWLMVEDRDGEGPDRRVAF